MDLRHTACVGTIGAMVWAAAVGGCSLALGSCGDGAGEPIVDEDGGRAADGGRTADGGLDADSGCGSLTRCGGACVDTASSPDNCGACGTACDVAGGEVCLRGSCETDCADLTECDGSCVNPSQDPLNCGGCGRACSVMNGTASCSGGDCVIGSCTAPFADCDGTVGNGCETDTSSDESNCGSCGAACSVAGGVPACVSGDCAIGSCTAPFADCDGTVGNGCETDTSSDESNCGTCGTACSVAGGIPACASGTCGVGSCTAPFEDCDGSYANGCEVDTSSDSDNCGACGTACMTTTRACVDSACLTGRVCIHAGEMRDPGTYGGGELFVTVCGTCALGDFASCPRYRLCTYAAPFCGGCLSGFADGDYTIAAFIDVDGDAAVADPMPDAGDAVPATCSTAMLTGGGTATPSPVNVIMRNRVP